MRVSQIPSSLKLVICVNSKMSDQPPRQISLRIKFPGSKRACAKRSSRYMHTRPGQIHKRSVHIEIIPRAAMRVFIFQRSVPLLTLEVSVHLLAYRLVSTRDSCPDAEPLKREKRMEIPKDGSYKIENLSRRAIKMRGRSMHPAN